MLALVLTRRGLTWARSSYGPATIELSTSSVKSWHGALSKSATERTPSTSLEQPARATTTASTSATQRGRAFCERTATSSGRTGRGQCAVPPRGEPVPSPGTRARLRDVQATVGVVAVVLTLVVATIAGFALRRRSGTFRPSRDEAFTAPVPPTL